MKFQFCGNTDCPEWILSEVSILANVSVMVLERVLELLVMKITSHPGFNESEMKQVNENLSDEDFQILLAMMDYILRSFRYNVDDDTLSNELL